jgi:hypothetical protein
MVKSVTKLFVFGTLVIDDSFQNRLAQFSFVPFIKKQDNHNSQFAHRWYIAGVLEEWNAQLENQNKIGFFSFF